MTRISDLEVVGMAARIRRMVTLATVLVAVGALLAPSALAGSRDTAPPPVLPTIYVVYALNCTFQIYDDFGKRLSSIPPGSYQIGVSTPVMFKLVVPGGPEGVAANDFNGCKGWVQFHVSGPGIDLFSTLDSGCDAFLMLPAQAFKAGSTYVFQDMNQPAATRTTLSVDTSGTPVIPTTNPYQPTSGKGELSTDSVGQNRAGPLKGRLAATLTSGGKLSLNTYSLTGGKGKPILTLRAGRYQFVVSDKSKQRGFVLEPVDGKPKSLSSAKFVGTVKKGVVLQAGRWTYSTGSGKAYYFLVTH